MAEPRSNDHIEGKRISSSGGEALLDDTGMIDAKTIEWRVLLKNAVVEIVKWCFLGSLHDALSNISL